MQRGITLIELLIALLFLGILAGLGAWRLGSSSPGFSWMECQHRRMAERKLRAILAAEQAYRHVEGAFTPNLSDLPLGDVQARTADDPVITYDLSRTTGNDFNGLARYARASGEVSVQLIHDADGLTEPREILLNNGWCP